VKKVDEMLATSTGLNRTPDAVNESIPQPPAAAPSVEAASAEVLISTQQVLIGTAAAQGTRHAHIGLAGRIAAAVRRMAAEANQPRLPHYPRQYGYIENARMAREMERL
jgi:hypothetical protein